MFSLVLLGQGFQVLDHIVLLRALPMYVSGSVFSAHNQLSGNYRRAPSGQLQAKRWN